MESTIAAGRRGTFEAPLRVLGDERLVRLAARGSEAAFATIFDRHHQALYCYALTILGNRDDAFDAVQNATVKLLRSLPGERREIKLKPWLFKVVHNEAISIIRQRGPVAEEGPEEKGAEDAPEERMRAQSIIADLSLLGEQQRSAVAMRELNGLSHGEIGAALGVSTAAAKQAVYEGRVALQQIEEGREMRCTEVQQSLSANDRRLIKGRRVRSHLRSCAACRAFEGSMAHRRTELAALAPLPAVLSAKLLAGALGSGSGPAGGLMVGAAGGAGAAHAIGAGTLAKFGAAAVLVVGGGVAVESEVGKSKAATEGANPPDLPALVVGPDSAEHRTAKVKEREHEKGTARLAEGRHAGGTPGGFARSGGEAGRGDGGERSAGTDNAAAGGSAAKADPGAGGNGGSSGSAGGNGGGTAGGEPDGGNGGGGDPPSSGNDDAGGGGGPTPDDEGPRPPHPRGPAHGQEVASSHDPGYPGSSASHAQKPASPPGLGAHADLPGLPDLPDLSGHGHGSK